jgi:hypothetical protein
MQDNKFVSTLDHGRPLSFAGSVLPQGICTVRLRLFFLLHRFGATPVVLGYPSDSQSYMYLQKLTNRAAGCGEPSRLTNHELR